MKAKHQRLFFVVASVAFLCIAAIFTLQAFRSNIVYFYSPSELESSRPKPDKLIRIGGLVEEGSIVRFEKDRISFKIRDSKTDVTVIYTGILPGLFRTSQGIIAEGYLVAPDMFQATVLLTKHDERYMPKEVVDELKRDGRWREDER